MLNWLVNIWTRLFVKRRLELVGAPPYDSWESRLCKVVESYKGRGECGGNNKGPFIEMIRDGGRKGPWCAALVSHCIIKSWHMINGDKKCPIKRCHAARKLFRSIGRRGRVLSGPKVGAIACWERGPSDSWKGHIGIITWVKGDRFGGYEGNVGKYPAVVDTREWTDVGRLIGFVELPVSESAL